MSYNFGAKILGLESLDHVSDFKNKINTLVTSSKYITWVGWRTDTPPILIDHLKKCGVQKIFIIEIFKPNTDDFPKQKYDKFVEMFCEDVRSFEKCVPPQFRECLLWQHGPEHLSMMDASRVILTAKKSYTKIVIETPLGDFPQGAEFGNQWETHLSSWSEQNYRDLGFEVVPYNNGRFLIGHYTKTNKKK